LNQGKEEAIGRFLKKFKTVARRRGVDFIPREAFIQTLASLGITRSICHDELLGLAVEDYCQGPEDNRDRLGEVWVFGKHMEGKEIYIKLKLAKVGKETIAKCLSFHIAEFPLCFPLARGKGGKEK
jgi:hypothetical protein